MSIRDQIAQQLAQQGQAPQGAPPGYGPPPSPTPQGFVPQGQPPQGAPLAQAYPQGAPQAPMGAQPFAGAPFQPAPGQPGFAPHVGPPEYQTVASAPAVAQAGQQGYTPPQPAQSAIPPQPIAQAAVAQQATVTGPLPYGTPYGGYTGYFHDGRGGYFQAAVETIVQPGAAAQLVPDRSLSQLAPGEPDTLGENEGGAAEADLAALGALFITLVQSAIGMLNGKPEGAADAPKKSRGRPKKSA